MNTSRVNHFAYYTTVYGKMQSCFSCQDMLYYALVIFVKRKLEGIFSLLLGTIIWGGAFTAQSVGMDRLGPFTFQAVRCFLAVLALVMFITLNEIRNMKQSFQRWADPKLWKAGCLCGAALFVATSLQQIGLVYTDAGKAGFITALYIVIVPMLGLFLGRKPSPAAFVGIVVAVIGMYLLCGVGVSSINIGDLLLIGCAFAFSLQIMLVDRLSYGCDSLRLNCIQALVVAVLSSLCMLTETVDWQLVMSCWLPLSYAGVLSMGVGYSLQIIGQKRIEPTAASMIMSLESVFAVVFGALLLHETMTTWESIGCVFVFAAVILSQLPSKKRSV